MRHAGGWLAETHSNRLELLRHFFARFFDSEFLSSPEQTKTVAGGAAAVLLSLGILLTQTYYHKYLILGELDDPAPFLRAERADVLFIVTLTMALIGIFTTLQWPALFPSLRDYLALAGLPVRMRDVFIAKFTALAVFAVMTIAATTALPSIVLPAVMSNGWDPQPVRQVPAIFVASSLAGGFVFLFLVAVQGLLLNVIPVRHFPQVSLWMQGILLIVFLCALPFVFSVPNLQSHMNERPSWAAYAPPLWFLGLDQAMVGNRENFPWRLTQLSVAGVGAVAVAAVLTYLWSYRRHRRRILESPSLVTTGKLAFPPALVDWLLPRPRTLATFDFTAKGLARSRHHRLILTAFCGAAIAVIVQQITGSLSAGSFERQAVIAGPLALSLFTLTGLRYLFRHPVELRANWLFRIQQSGCAEELLAGVERFLFYCAVLPIVVLALPAEVRALGVAPGLWATLALLLVSLILMETVLFSFEKIPFTCSYLPGRRMLIETVLRSAVVVVLWIGGLSVLMRWCLQDWRRSGALIFVLLAGWVTARRARLSWQKVDRLEFEEGLEPAVQVLAIERD